METLRFLPAIDHRSRFGSVAFGYDRLEVLRQEHLALVAIVAPLCGRTAETLTLADCEKLQPRIEAFLRILHEHAQGRVDVDADR